MGTRFYASTEAAGSGEAKKRIVAANGDRTIRSILFDIARGNVWPAPYTGRLLENQFTEKWRGPRAELLQNQDGEVARYSAARAAEDFDTAGVIAGESADLVNEILPATEIVEKTVNEATPRSGPSNRYRVTTV